VLVSVLPASNSSVIWLGYPATTLTRLAGPTPTDGMAYGTDDDLRGLDGGLTKGEILPKSIPADVPQRTDRLVKRGPEFSPRGRLLL